MNLFKHTNMYLCTAKKDLSFTFEHWEILNHLKQLMQSHSKGTPWSCRLSGNTLCYVEGSCEVTIGFQKGERGDTRVSTPAFSHCPFHFSLITQQGTFGGCGAFPLRPPISRVLFPVWLGLFPAEADSSRRLARTARSALSDRIQSVSSLPRSN